MREIHTGNSLSTRTGCVMSNALAVAIRHACSWIDSHDPPRAGTLFVDAPLDSTNLQAQISNLARFFSSAADADDRITDSALLVGLALRALVDRASSALGRAFTSVRSGTPDATQNEWVTVLLTLSETLANSGVHVRDLATSICAKLFAFDDADDGLGRTRLLISPPFQDAIRKAIVDASERNDETAHVLFVREEFGSSEELRAHGASLEELCARYESLLCAEPDHPNAHMYRRELGECRDELEAIYGFGYRAGEAGSARSFDDLERSRGSEFADECLTVFSDLTSKKKTPKECGETLASFVVPTRIGEAAARKLAVATLMLLEEHTRVVGSMEACRRT